MSPDSGRSRSAVYLDHAATTPLDPQVFAAMQPYFTERFGNAGSVHQFGQTARGAVDEARGIVAGLLGAQPKEIVFTSGATEANNAAIIGVVQASPLPAKHVITSATEHHAVLEPCHWLAARGVQLTILPVDRFGIVDPEDVRRAIRPETVLVTIMHANNEIGTIAPIAEIGAITRERGVRLHTDATQSAGLIPLNVDALHVDLLSISAHKRYGPKGAGALYTRAGVRIERFIHGGSQERGRRGGTENVTGVVGLGEAMRIAIERMTDDAARIGALRDRLAAGLGAIDGAIINGHPTSHLPGIVNVSFADADSESLLLALDLDGIAASSGSACTAGSLEPSHVIASLEIPDTHVMGTLRFSLGRWTTADHIDAVLETMPKILSSIRRPAGQRR